MSSLKSASMLTILRPLLKTILPFFSLFDAIVFYERGSGAKLNLSKTEAMWLGA